MGREERDKDVVYSSVIASDYMSFTYTEIAREIGKVLEANGITGVVKHWWDIQPNIKNLIFVGSALKQTLNYLWRFDSSTNIVFYVTCEGLPILSNIDVEAVNRDNVKVVAVSNFVKKMLEAVGIKVHDVIYHAIDMDDHLVHEEFRDDVKKKFNLEKRKVLLNISDNNARKGLDNLLVAYKTLNYLIPETFLILHTFPGKPGYGGINILKYSEILELKNYWCTMLMGCLTRPKVNALYDLSRFYVCSSYSEGFGLPMIESFRFNKPVIAVDAPPFNEIVENGKTGILLPVRETKWFEIKKLMRALMNIYAVDDLIDAMTSLCVDDDLYDKLCENIKVAKYRFHSPNVYKKFLEYLE